MHFHIRALRVKSDIFAKFDAILVTCTLKSRNLDLAVSLSQIRAQKYK